MSIEWIGIAGTVLILIAFLCNDEKGIRILDAIGAAAFVVYGLLTQTWSTFALNIALIGIQVWKLMSMKRRR